MANDRMSEVQFNRKQNRFLLNTLEPGDLIKIKPALFRHWCVYIGGEEVVHVVGYNAASMNSASSFTGLLNGYSMSVVKRDNIWDVVKDKLMEKDNSLDTSQKHFSGDEVVSRALSKIGPIKYHTFLKNCEHFAKWCRYDTEESEQSQVALFGAAVGGFIVAGPLGAIFTGASAVAKMIYDQVQDQKKEDETRVTPYNNRYM
ncbi:phospholipase A and acyltransferase 3-like [Physella acuta]|uniref:phospholipase A and acyltransferase 3-like n=1 Tax=Physella acuta TaxID=109671 RepID=UPI0027DDFDBA|nr:phospholipase A and acyltransferase 3-like [Physella acuta]